MHPFPNHCRSHSHPKWWFTLTQWDVMGTRDLAMSGLVSLLKTTKGCHYMYKKGAITTFLFIWAMNPEWATKPLWGMVTLETECELIANDLITASYIHSVNTGVHVNVCICVDTVFTLHSWACGVIILLKLNFLYTDPY